MHAITQQYVSAMTLHLHLIAVYVDGYRPWVLYTSSGILNTVDPLASASNLYIKMIIKKNKKTM